MSRPTEDELEDASEVGRCGCLLPTGDAVQPNDDDCGEEDDDD